MPICRTLACLYMHSSARRNMFCNLAMGFHLMHEVFYKYKHAVQVLIISQKQGRKIKANCNCMGNTSDPSKLLDPEVCKNSVWSCKIRRSCLDLYRQARRDSRSPGARHHHRLVPLLASLSGHEVLSLGQWLALPHDECRDLQAPRVWLR